MSSNPPDPALPGFLITIDTEGDNLWAAPREITTRNAGFLSRFQALCEKYRLKPTWLTNYEMATSPVFQEFARDVLRRDTAEVGLHLHAWNSPPIVPLTDDDFKYQPYLIEYPSEIIGEKVHTLTGMLEDTFGVKMVSHRAGRWSMNPVYARALVDHGYRVDCSVTPHVSWQHAKGDPAQGGGTDFSQYPEGPYFPDLNDLGRPGRSDLLELPMTILRSEYGVLNRIGTTFPRRSLPGRMWNRLLPAVLWLVPMAETCARCASSSRECSKSGWHTPNSCCTRPNSCLAEARLFEPRRRSRASIGTSSGFSPAPWGASLA